MHYFENFRGGKCPPGCAPAEGSSYICCVHSNTARDVGHYCWD